MLPAEAADLFEGRNDAWVSMKTTPEDMTQCGVVRIFIGDIANDGDLNPNIALVPVK